MKYEVCYYNEKGELIAQKTYAKRGNAERFASKLIYDNKAESAIIYLINAVYNPNDLAVPLTSYRALRGYTKLHKNSLNIIDYSEDYVK